MEQTLAAQSRIHQLWRSITSELTSVFDAHFVCATVASEVAKHMEITAVVGIRAPQQEFYDVWICHADGSMQQKRWDSDKASFGAILEAGSAVRLEKFSRPVTEQIKSELWLLPREEILAVPLPYPKGYNQVAPPGVVCLIDPTGSCPLKTDDIEQLASIVTVFLDRAYLRHQVDRQEVEFAVISDISHTLTSTLSMENIFRQLTGTIRRTLNVEELSVGLTDSATGEIVFVKSLMGPMFDDMPTIRVKRGQGIAGWVAENQQPLIINDTYSDKRFYTRVDSQSGFRTNSMICIPLQVETRTIGVLQAINRQHGEFTNHDLRLLQAIGGPLAASIENARLHTDVLSEKRRIETIFNSMSEGMITINADNIVTNVNDALGALLLSDATEALGKPIVDVIHFKSAEIETFIQAVVNAEDEYPQLAGDLRQADLSFVPVLLSGAAVRDENNDVTEIILVFSDLRQIREVERMRDDFFHGIVHELRTPLATILMYARLLREGKAQGEEKQARFLGVIERESDRLQKMVRQMLELAKLEARELQRSVEPVALNPLFDEMLPPLADRATEKGLMFSQRIEPDLPQVMGNIDTLHLIFKNLIDNAIKFTPSGSVKVDVRQRTDQVVVTVKDDGIGIPAQALPNMFKRFYRTQTAVEKGIAGTGLGLYMVKESVEHYNGTITVDSSEGKGTTFTVKLPSVRF